MVYRAVEVHTRHVYAIKLIETRDAEDEQLQLLLGREIQVMRQVSCSLLLKLPVRGSVWGTSSMPWGALQGQQRVVDWLLLSTWRAACQRVVGWLLYCMPCGSHCVLSQVAPCINLLGYFGHYAHGSQIGISMEYPPLLLSASACSHTTRRFCDAGSITSVIRATEMPFDEVSVTLAAHIALGAMCGYWLVAANVGVLACG